MRIFHFFEIRYYKHYLYEYRIGNNLISKNRLSLFYVDESTAASVNRSSELKKMMEEQPGKLIGYGFRDSNGDTVGHIYVMFNGGKEIRFKIKNIDAYVFAVEVFEKYRGNGYAEEMVTMVIKDLNKNRNLKVFHLTVEKNNKIAIHVYEKMGFKRINRNINYLRICGFNIPYVNL